MRFQTTLHNTTQDSFMEDLLRQINEVLEIININTPGIKLAPWHTEDIIESELISDISDSPLDAVRYLYGFKAGVSRSGTQYFRIRMVFPATYTPEEIVQKNKGSIMVAGKQSLLKANSQSVNPTVIGWLFRSKPTMVDFSDLEKVLKAIWSIKDGFGLYWAAVKDGKPYDSATTARAIHIETEETNLQRIGLLAEKTYGQASKKVKDYPLGINMMFVKQYNDVKGSAKAVVEKLSTYQRKHEQVMDSHSWFGSLAIDKSVTREGFRSLRQWLMNLKSINPKLNKDGKQYFDNVFTSIHKSDDGQEYRFYFSKINATEATNVIMALPLVIRDELRLEPTSFIHKEDVENIMEGQWDAHTRVYKNKNMLNQEQYMDEMEEFFSANNIFLGNTGELNPLSNAEIQKQVAMANGEDEVSVISNLTDKTLQDATLPQQTSSRDSDSVQSCMTSKSKTRLAVKEALQVVTTERRRALQEQQQRFQKEIDELKKLLATQHQTPKKNNTSTQDVTQSHTTLEKDQRSNDDASVSSSSLNSLQQKVQAVITLSPAAKRPRRSSSRMKRNSGGSSKSATKNHD